MEKNPDGAKLGCLLCMVSVPVYIIPFINFFDYCIYYRVHYFYFPHPHSGEPSDNAFFHACVPKSA